MLRGPLYRAIFRSSRASLGTKFSRAAGNIRLLAALFMPESIRFVVYVDFLA